MKSWQDILYGFVVGLILIWFSVEFVALKERVEALENYKPAYYLVHSVTGKELRLAEIK